MSVLVILRWKCTVAMSCAAPWWVSWVCASCLIRYCRQRSSLLCTSALRRPRGPMC